MVKVLTKCYLSSYIYSGAKRGRNIKTLEGKIIALCRSREICEDTKVEHTLVRQQVTLLSMWLNNMVSSN